MSIEPIAINGTAGNVPGETLDIGMPPGFPRPTSEAQSVVRDCHAAGPSDGLVRARWYLRTHVADSVSLGELARIAGLSKYYFLRVFTRVYGVTPHEYQMRLRLERARQLIVEGRALSYVAYDAGFADQSHLTRRFKQSFGVTPGAYRRWGTGDENAAA